ncbi:MAG: type II toxin-antitoxin system RelE/ParE family toxin [Bacteroidota bacterium]|jgi:proteic killer suppression protein
MIRSFGNKETRQIWEGLRIKWLPVALQEAARRKLRMLNSAQSLLDLQIPPSNRLEKLKGDLREYHSIRVNDQWRIVFMWESGNAENVSLIDYH